MRSLNPYVLDGENQSVYLTLEEVSPEDTREIEKEWQSYWGTGYLEDPRLLLDTLPKRPKTSWVRWRYPLGAAQNGF